MRIKYLKLKSWLIASAASLLGINISCEMPVEYGTPEARYDVKGVVSAPDGSPVQGIAVGYHSDTTDAQGRYQVSYHIFPNEDIQLSFSDIDSTLNGSFRDTPVTLATHDVPLTDGDGHWFHGHGSINYNITLTPR